MKKIYFRDYDEIYKVIPEIFDVLPEFIQNFLKEKWEVWEHIAVLWATKSVQWATKIRYPTLTINEIRTMIIDFTNYNENLKNSQK